MNKQKIQLSPYLCVVSDNGRSEAPKFEKAAIVGLLLMLILKTYLTRSYFDWNFY